MAVLFISADNVNEIYDLKDATEQAIISTAISGNDESPHYTKPLLLTLKNLKSKSVTIKVSNGQQFLSKDPDTQDIIVNKEEMITLNAHETKTLPLYGMCTQQNNGGPGISSEYTLGTVADGNLVALTKEIEKRKAFNTLGQYAVWSITENNHLNSISGFDEEEALYLKTFVAGLKNIPVPEYDPDDYLTNYTNNHLVKRSAKGNFRFKFSEESAVTIAMFDENDIVVRELYNNPKVASGTHDLNFEFDVSVYQNKAYYVRMIVDGDIKINMKMEPRGS